jgi:excisionase family DNA binding protein
MPEELPKLLTPGQCANRRGVSRQAIAEAIKADRIKSTRVGRHYVITEKDCDAYPISEAHQNAGRSAARRWQAEEEKP